MPLVAAVTQLAPPSVERSMRNPVSLLDWSSHKPYTLLLDVGCTPRPDGATGGVVASTTWAASELLDDPPSFLAYTTYQRSEEHTSELQSLAYLVCRLLLEKKKKKKKEL